MKKLEVVMMIGLSAAVLTSCNQASKNTSNQEVKDSAKTTEVTPVVLKDGQINAAYKNYELLKDALVASNVGNAQKAAMSLSGSLKNIQGCQSTAEIATQIGTSKKLDQQRADFTRLSADFIPLIKHAEVENGTLYVQFCPMANSGRGGYWIASHEEIRNPYYGDEMLHCGEVKDTINRNSSAGEKTSL
jgi:hypothetical protein